MAPADEEHLVLRAAAGDLDAFDQLVRRHRGAVLRTMRSTLSDPDVAEDAAQEALLAAYASLPTLRDPLRFGAWLNTVTRRVAIRALRRRQARDRQVIEWSAGMIRVEGRNRREGVQGPVVERVREAIEELAGRHRQVTTLHYLKGLSVADISRTLHLPVGSVKRILHEARREIREECGVVPTAEKPPVPRLKYWIDGWYDGSNPRNVFSLMGWPLSQSICLAASKRPRSLAAISRAVRAHDTYVADTAARLVEEAILEEQAGRYVTNFVALSADDWAGLTRDVRRAGRAAADLLAPHLPGIRAAYEMAPVASQWPWNEVVWIIVGVFLCNTASRRAFASEALPPPPARASGAEYWLAGYETTAPEELLWCTGLNANHGGPDSLGHGFLWSYGLPRQFVDVGRAQGQLLAALHSGSATAAEAGPHVGGGSQYAETIAARWVMDGRLRREDGRLALAFPVFGPADDRSLLAPIDAAAGQVAEQVLRPATLEVQDRLREMGYRHLEDQLGLWPRWLRGYINGEAIHALFEDGLLPAPETPAPACFGFFGWEAGTRLVRSE